MTYRPALLICGGALAAIFAAVAVAAAAQPKSLQNNDGGPEQAAVDPATIQGLPAARDYRPPDGIVFRAADFFSDNVRLTAQWLSPAGHEGQRLPTVVMAPGWGATAATLRQDAVDLAHAGYRVMLFDYRGWGDSDGRVVLTTPRAREAAPAAGDTFMAQAHELRGYIDPWEQAEDWFNAISYAVTDPGVDVRHLGVLGSDLAGGHVIYLAAGDPRVAAVVSQVTHADLRPSKPYQPDPAKVIAEAYAAASRLAAGQEAYPADRVRAGGAVGAPPGSKLVRWTPVEHADDVEAPALFVLAEKEELFSNTFNGQQACEGVRGPRKMVILPGITHYGIYGAERTRAINAAIDWFDRYLKPPGEPTRVPLDLKQPARGPCNPPPLPPAGEEKKDGSGQGHKAQATSGRFD